MVPRPIRIVAGPVLLLLTVAFAALAMSLSFGGGAGSRAVLDSGPIVFYGLSIAKLAVTLGGAVTIGALVLACFALDAGKPEFGRAVDVAAVSAAAWTVAAAVAGFFTFLSASGQAPGLDAAFGSALARFLTSTELGQFWLVTTLVAAAVTSLCFAVRNVTILAFVAALAVAGLVPIALQGHPGGTAGHDSAGGALFLHMLFAGIWLGGLVTLAIIRPTLGEGRIGVVFMRYSTLALVCFIVVAASGYVNAQLRLESVGNLFTPYGALVLVKAATLLTLGVLGAAQRRYFIRRMNRAEPRGGRYFWWLVVAELAFMGIASGVATALARTPEPRPPIAASNLANPSPAELLTGSPLPPPITAERLFTLWNLDLIWILACAFAIFFYGAAVFRLRRRGDAWPVHRTVFWVLGILALFYVTNGGVNVYERYLFSSHMLAHMMLGMVIPVLLVPGAPITLALRTIAKRTDESRGPREWILLAVHSRVFGVLASPLVAAGLFGASLLAFYYTPLFSWSTTSAIGHEWMIVHFLIVGYLFVQSLVGLDPSPERAPYPIRLIILLATMAFHAFFGLALLSGTGLLLANWYGAMGWATGISAIADQQTGGGIAWSVGEIPTVVLAIVVAILWYRSDGRESKRYDRKAARDGDAELAEYNAMLAKRAGGR